MPTCFVIQPFDKGRFDKRYRDVYAPAIVAAGFEPYRVDRDDGVTVPIESIESGIRQAEVCFADITIDNPNVWYELGFAFASRRPVILACSEERVGTKFPFDIQHRSVVIYKTESQSDFETLGKELTRKIAAVTARAEQLETLATDLVAPTSGLSQTEFMLLAVIASGIFSPTSSIPAWTVIQDAEKAGLTKMGFNLALRRLEGKAFVSTVLEHDPMDGEGYTALRISDMGWDWISDNESRFVLQRATNGPEEEIEDEEPPF